MSSMPVAIAPISTTTARMSIRRMARIAVFRSVN
jgi:hypothetical protein